MAARRRQKDVEQPRLVRKSFLVDPAKLEQARKLLGAASDADVLRLALEHLLSHVQAQYGEEEE